MNLSEGVTRECDLRPLVDVPTVRVTGPDGVTKARGYYAMFVDHVPGADGLVRDEWVHHVVLTRSFADWHMPCEPRLYEIRSEDIVEIDAEQSLPSRKDGAERAELLRRIRELEEENRFLRDADNEWKRLVSEWHDEIDAVSERSRGRDSDIPVAFDQT